MASKVPKELKYTSEHEWLKIDGKRARIGITDFAQDQLTDVVYVELPDVGETFKAGDSVGVVESVKSVSDIYAPVACKVVEVNDALEESPELVNSDPYGQGWMVVLEITDPAEVGKLLDADGYTKVTEAGH